MEIWESRLATEINNGGFELSIVASFVGVGSVKYVLRIEKPNWDRVDYVISVEGLKKLGELFSALYSFTEEKLSFNDKAEIRDLLTAENIQQYANLKKAVRISQ